MRWSRQFSATNGTSEIHNFFFREADFGWHCKSALSLHVPASKLSLETNKKNEADGCGKIGSKKHREVDMGAGKLIDLFSLSWCIFFCSGAVYFSVILPGHHKSKRCVWMKNVIKRSLCLFHWKRSVSLFFPTIALPCVLCLVFFFYGLGIFSVQDQG